MRLIKLKTLAPALLSAALLAGISGCGGSAAETRTTPPETEEKTVSAPAETQVPVVETETPDSSPSPEPTAAPEPPTATAAAAGAPEESPDYSPVLDELCHYITHGSPWWEYGPRDMPGIVEMYQYLEKDTADELGYTYLDISGDGVPELLIGIKDPGDSEQFRGSTVYNVFTWSDGAPEVSLVGWARSSYDWIGDGRFFYMGSSGAAYTVAGVYRISDDGRKLICEDFYFTWPLDSDGDGEDDTVGFYHNTHGESDLETSELVPEQDFSSALDRWNGLETSLELTPLSEYLRTWQARPENRGEPLWACWGEETPAAYSDFLTWEDSGEETAAEVTLIAGETLTDFRLLALTAGEWDGETMPFSAEERYSLDVLTPEKPLKAKLAFYGDIPNNGVAFRDAAGTERTYALDISGRDGSLLLWEIHTDAGSNR